jgi:hypothetical protein
VKTLIACLLVLAMSTHGLAWSGPDQKHIEKIQKKVSQYVERGSMVSVETYDQHQMWGSIAEAGPDSFVLVVANTPTTMKYADIKKIKAPMDRGTKTRIVTAIVVGGLLGLTLVAAAQDR